MSTSTAESHELRVHATDVYAQKEAVINNAPAAATVSEMVESLVQDMRLPRHDPLGKPLVYYARLEREGRQLNGAEPLGEALESGDRITVVPQIKAGGSRAS